MACGVYWALPLSLGVQSFDDRELHFPGRRHDGARGALDGGERPIAGSETLSNEDLAFEALMFGLRTAAGIDLRDFRWRLGIGLAAQNRRLIDD